MRRRFAWIASLLLCGVASADDAAPADPRDVFGLKRKPIAETSCDDGRALGCTTAEDPFDPVAPMALRSWLPSTYLLHLPVADARHDQVAHFATGASLDDVGVAFAGATGLENTWTVEGAPIENARNGNVETHVPLTFMTGMLVTAGGYGARDRAALGGSIDVELRRGGDHHEVEAYAWGGLTEAARERPIPNATYQLRRLAITSGPEASFSTVATGPLPRLYGGRTWYAAGIAGSISQANLDWRAAKLVDADNDGVPDGFPGQVALDVVEDTSATKLDYLIPMMARAGWKRGHHEFVVTGLGNLSSDGFFLGNATQQASGIARRTTVLDGIATWKGSWTATHARAMVAWHRSARRESAFDSAAAGKPQLLSIFVPNTLPEDQGLADACNDGDGDLTPNIPNCPIPFGFFASGGAGLLTDSVSDHPTLSADVAHREGSHVLRAGGIFEDTRLVTTSRFTGGELVRSALQGLGDADHQRFFSGSCGADTGSPCNYTDEGVLRFRTRYMAIYAEDTFQPIPAIRVDTGLRSELMWVGGNLHFSNELAPRLGIAWDILGAAPRTSRLWASMGRTHAMLPAGMGPLVIARNTTVRDRDILGEPVDRNIDTGNVFDVAEDIQPITQDEVATGLEVGIIDALRGGIWVQRRSLRRGLDTVLVNKNTLLVNFDNPDGDDTVAAYRETTTVAIEVKIAPTPKLSVRATYLWGTAVGTWTGPFDPRQGTTLYAGTDWDLDASNLYGRLPTDPGHRVAIEGERRGSIAGIDFAASTRLTVASGKPQNVFGDSDLGPVHLLPRGSLGRDPLLTQVTARLAARWRGIDFTLDIFNALDRREPTSRGEFYTGDSVRPIIGGSYEDLIFAKNETCDELSCSINPLQRRASYSLPVTFQAPRSFIVGVHHAF
ncbi:MAG: hypothetical protein ABI867_34345 [Kofleriaceae bacterium]